MAYTQKGGQAVARYKAKAYKRIPLDLPKGFAEMIIAHAKEHGESTNGFIRRAIENQIKADNNK